MSIFTITVLSQDLRRTRVWGWFPDLESARVLVLANATDMFECGYYDYAVVEEIPSGICALPESATWFYADYEGTYDNKPFVTEIPQPPKFNNIVGFGMG